MWIASRADDGDGDGDGIADHVPDGGVASEAGELRELVVVEVSRDLDAHLDPLVAGADVAVQTEESLQIQVTLDLALQALQGDAASGRVVHDRAGQARPESLEGVLAGVGSPVLAQQDRRLVGLQNEWLFAGGVLLSRPVEALDHGPTVAAVDPVGAGAELELPQRGVGGDCVDRSGEAFQVDAVDGAGSVHGGSFDATRPAQPARIVSTIGRADSESTTGRANLSTMTTSTADQRNDGQR